MKTLGVPTKDAQVTIAAMITASVKDPVVAIQSMSLIGKHSARFRMVCHTLGECLPFYATATWPEESSVISVPEALNTSKSATKNVAGSQRHIPARPTTANGQDGGSMESIAEGQPILRAGTSSTMIIEAERIHIRLKVICLQGGAAGDKVRVATPNRKQAYTAEILTPTLLKGTL